MTTIARRRIDAAGEVEGRVLPALFRPRLGAACPAEGFVCRRVP
jgi:hypothetical protein